MLQHYNSKDRKEKQLISEVERIDFILTPNEVEALILEQRKISELDPKYNVSFKDDKSYPYVKITVSEKYPRMLMVRKLKVGEDQNAEFIGPFANVEDLKRTFNYLRSFFPLANCKNKIIELGRKRPCLQYSIRRCPGPCFQYVDPAEYSKSLEYMKLFFKGRGETLIENLKREMEEAASRQEFEKAALMRDRLFAVNKILDSRKVKLGGGESIAFITLVREYNEALVGVLSVTSEGIASQRYYKVKVNEFNTDSEVFETLITRLYFNTAETPSKIIIDSDDGNLLSLLGKLLGLNNRQVTVTQCLSQLDKEYLSLLREATAAEFKRRLIKELSDRKRLEETVRELSSLFPAYDFNKHPLIIEAFDISNIRGRQPVGSKVVFLDGYPFKKSYRMYKIKTVEAQDDYDMLREVLTRRLRKIGLENDKIPALIVVDGGRGQLNTALEVLKNLGLNIPVIGLAKEREEVYTAFSKEPLIFPDDSGFKKTLQYIRDEAHRFAVNYHRKLRAKQFFESVLDNITGIGEQLKKRIRLNYPDLEILRSESPDNLVKKLGVSYKLAIKIKESLLKS